VRASYKGAEAGGKSVCHREHDHHGRIIEVVLGDVATEVEPESRKHVGGYKLDGWKCLSSSKRTMYDLPHNTSRHSNAQTQN